MHQRPTCDPQPLLARLYLKTQQLSGIVSTASFYILVFPQYYGCITYHRGDLRSFLYFDIDFLSQASYEWMVPLCCAFTPALLQHTCVTCQRSTVQWTAVAMQGCPVCGLAFSNATAEASSASHQPFWLKRLLSSFCKRGASVEISHLTHGFHEQFYSHLNSLPLVRTIPLLHTWICLDCIVYAFL